MEEKMREDLKDARWTSWTEEELATLKDNYPKIGLKVTSLLPDRSYNSVRGMVSHLKLKREGNGKKSPWTEEELQILKKWYPVDPEEAVKRIPLHTKGSIGVKASHLGMTKTEEQDSRTKEEEEILKEWYPVNRKEAAKKLPGRSADAICAKAQRMGLAGSGNPAGKTEMKEVPLCRKWTMEEDSLIREFYPSEGPSVANRLLGRTESACTIRASVLGVTYTRNNNRYWSDEEDQVLRTFWKAEGKEVSDRLPLRSRTACAARAGKLGLDQPLQAAPKGEAWSLEDLAIFMNYFPQERFAVMNRMAGGHTSLNCEKIAKYLGYLPAYSLREGWSEGEDKIIADVYPVEKAETVRLLPKRTRCATMVRGRDHLNKPSEKVSSVKHWTDDEIAILKEKYPTEGRNVQKWLPGRKLGDIQQKARYLQVRVEGKENFYWTAAEKETLLAYYPSEGPDVCRRLPDRTSSACTNMYWKLVSGKKKEPVRRRWTEAEVNILKKYYPTEGKDVALRLPGWSQKKCMEKALLLGMKKPGKKQPRGLSEIFTVAEELKETPVKGICIV